MTRPGVEVTSRAARVSAGLPVSTGTWFVAGLSERGPGDTPVLIPSLTDYESTYGDRVAYGQLWDALDVFFSEGGGEAYVARVVGPGAIKGSLTLMDRAGAPIATLRIDALYVGDYSDGVTVEVQDGTTANTFRLIVRHDGVEVERFDNLVMEPTTSADYAPDRLATSDWIRGVDLNSATAGATANPAVLAATALSAGTDDRANAVDAHWLAALDLFTADLGPGQVSSPGRTSTAAHQQLIDHAADKNRTAYLDTVDQASKATLDAAANAVEVYAGAERAGLFGSWVVAPGVSESGGLVRAVPGSAFAAAKTAATDRAFGVAGIAPAGVIKGVADYILDIRLPTPGHTDQQYEDLNENGVNMIRSFRGLGVMLYGFRAVSKDAEWLQLTAHRERMALSAELDSQAQRFVFEQNTTQVRADFNAALSGVCLRHYRAGALYGDTPEEAFRVDTSGAVNTTTRIQAGELWAAVYARFAPFAELVRIDIVKVPISTAVA